MQKGTKEEMAGKELIFRVPLTELYKFNERATVRSLVDSHRETVEKRNDISPVKRFIVSVSGLFFLMIGLMGLFSKDFNILNVIMIAVGIAVIWFFLAKPDAEKKMVKKETSKEGNVVVTFDDSAMVIASQYHETKREWREFIAYKRTKKGIQLSFADGIVTWLPVAVFTEKDTMKDLVDFLHGRVPRN